MLDEQYWAIYFAGIAAIRFHPKDDHPRLTDKERVSRAAEIADMMLDEQKRRFVKCGQR